MNQKSKIFVEDELLKYLKKCESKLINPIVIHKKGSSNSKYMLEYLNMFIKYDVFGEDEFLTPIRISISGLMNTKVKANPYGELETSKLTINFLKRPYAGFDDEKLTILMAGKNRLLIKTIKFLEHMMVDKMKEPGCSKTSIIQSSAKGVELSTEKFNPIIRIPLKYDYNTKKITTKLSTSSKLKANLPKIKIEDQALEIKTNSELLGYFNNLKDIILDVQITVGQVLLRKKEKQYKILSNIDNMAILYSRKRPYPSCYYEEPLDVIPQNE